MADLSSEQSNSIWDRLCKTNQVPERFRALKCSKKDDEDDGGTTSAEKGYCTEYSCRQGIEKIMTARI